MSLRLAPVDGVVRRPSGAIAVWPGQFPATPTVRRTDARGSAMAKQRRDRRTDQELLAAALSVEPEAFTVFYSRHVDVVLAFLRRRTASAEIAADLMAETFAAALLALHTDTEPEELE